MGVYINMEMPKNCGECPMICEDDLCRITKGGRTLAERPPHCPLIETKWISVTERLPEAYTSVLLYSGEELYTGYMHSDKRFTVNASHFPDRPTHWMPLPEPPKEE